MTPLSPPRAEPFLVEVEPDGDRDGVRVVPVGELDLGTAPALDEQLDRLLLSGRRAVVLDLRGLKFMDTSGLRLVLQLDARARRDGVELALVAGSPAVQRVFEIGGLADRLPFRAA
jgi:anti-anti-sigma factor